MVEVAAFPDSEALAMGIIQQAVVGVLVGGNPLFVGSSFPGKEKLPVILVSRWGGVPVMEEWIDRSRLQIEAWASYKSQARQVLDLARVALLQARGQVFTTGGGDRANAVVNNVTTDLGPTWQPDTVTQIDRYIMGMAIVLHPLPS